MKNTLLVVVALVAAFLIYRMMQPQNSSQMTAEPTGTDMTGLEEDLDATELAEEEETEASMSLDVGDPTVVDVEGGMFYFKPDMLTVKKGETVKIVFKNIAGVHDFVIDELSVKTPVIKQDETAEVTFVADKVGTFEFYCSVGDHRARGMVGTIVVEE